MNIPADSVVTLWSNENLSVVKGGSRDEWLNRIRDSIGPRTLTVVVIGPEEGSTGSLTTLTKVVRQWKVPTRD